MSSAACPSWFGLAVMLAITCGSGCATFQKDQGPVYRFARRHRAKPVEVTTVSLKFRDRRPTWERKYHRPLVDPQRKQMGVELLTADNFEPNPINQFKHLLSAKLAELETPPSSAEVIIKRLHVVIKYATSPRQAKVVDPLFKFDSSGSTALEDPVVTQVRRDDAYVTARKNWEQADRKAQASGAKSPPEPKYNDYNASKDDNDGGILGAIGGALVVGSLNLAWMAANALPGLANESLETARFYANQGPPPAWAQVDPGVTCQMEGTVTLRWADGRETTIPINVKQTEKYDLALNTPNYQVTPFLADVISETVDELAIQAADFATVEPAKQVSADDRAPGIARP